MKLTVSDPKQRGSTLILCVITIALLAFMAASTLQKVGPKFHMAYQTASWQEARLAAEAGVDVTMGELSRNSAAGASPDVWTGWNHESNGVIGPALASVLGLVNSILSLLLGGSGQVSDPIFMDNLNVSTPNGSQSEVDVQLWAVYPATNMTKRWFRVRSMATCAMPPTAYTAPDSLDSPLRRYSLRSIRPQLKKDDVGLPMTVRTPSASRTVEVLVEPILPFELAIWTDQTLSLGTSGTWGVDSYDSRDVKKSNPDGTYPGLSSPKTQANGNIASNRGRTPDSLYGSLIAANGAHVRGGVATNGGDDESTDAHENVSGASGIDPARVRDDFFREMKPMARPSSGILLPQPILGLPFLAGSDVVPTKYLVTGNLGAFKVMPLPLGSKGAIIIMVNGDLNFANGSFSIPPNVTVQIYVRGNIDFHENTVNSDPDSNNIPGQLQIYGEDSKGDPRTLRADGNASICAAFYGPSYDVKLADNVEWFGSVAARSFEMLGGGTGGFHYDEALGQVGAPVSFRIVRYVEDVRE